MFFCPLQARSPLVCCKCVCHTPAKAAATATATALEFSSILFCAKSLWGGTTGTAADATADVAAAATTAATVEPVATAAATSEFHLGLF